jgi:nickel/cobalt transporter (NicO) family protein
MRKVFIAIFGILFFGSYAFACALCSMSVPTVYVSINAAGNLGKVSYVDVQWRFGEEFTKVVMQAHDTDRNGILEGNELRAVSRSLLDYIAPKRYLTHIDSFVGESTQSKNINFKVISQKLEFEYNKLFFSYRLETDAKIQDDMTLSFVFDDDGGYFMFMTSPDSATLTLPSGWESEINAYSNIAIFNIRKKSSKNAAEMGRTAKIDSAKLEQNARVNLKELPQTLQTTESNATTAIQNKQDDSQILQAARALLTDLSYGIKMHLASIKQDGSPTAYLSLLFFSLIYGALHAMGPGHGKSLVAAYFMAHERSYARAALMSAMIGVTHTFSAFVLTAVAYFAFGIFFGGFIIDVGQWATKVSALVIIAIALYLGYKRIPKSSKILRWSAHPNACVCKACKTGGEGSDIGIVLSAGLVPCPGTVGVFMFSVSLGMFFVGFMSALAMSIGMSLVILLSSVITIKVRKSAENRYAKLALYLNFAAIFVMICLGALLLLV